VRFISSGAIGVLLYYATLYALTEFMGVWYLASAIAASLLNLSSNFILHKVWTFESMGFQNVHREAMKYGVMAALFIILNLVFLYALVEWGGLWYLAAQVLVTVVLTISSFFLSRRIFAAG
jgi:dolichol-phosphate mannosyltransferase